MKPRYRCLNCKYVLVEKSEGVYADLRGTKGCLWVISGVKDVKWNFAPHVPQVDAEPKPLPGKQDRRADFNAANEVWRNA